MKWAAIEESSSTYIRGLSKINANILGINRIDCEIYITIVCYHMIVKFAIDIIRL